MKKLALLSIGALVLVGCDSDEVLMVKGGTLNNCPNKTIEQMVDGYMASPSWESGVADDGKTYVTIKGGITYNEKPVDAAVQFVVGEKTFQFQAIEINEVPMNGLVGLSLLSKMCQSGS